MRRPAPEGFKQLVRGILYMLTFRYGVFDAI